MSTKFGECQALLLKEWNLPEELVILNGDGHTWFALDYRNNRVEPAVSYIDTDGDLDFVLADNFDEFIKDLYIEEEGLYRFNPDEDEDYKLDAMPEDELISLLQSGQFTKIKKALDNLFYYPKNSITENCPKFIK
ncbi:SMI1/KNR4 family protein [Gracilibacillus sp. Marseille-QA3620]